MAEKWDFKSKLFGIANNSGGLWSHQTFYTEEEAATFLRDHHLQKTSDLSNHKVVPVSVFINIQK